MMINDANITTPTNGWRIRASCGVPRICISQLKDGKKKPNPLTAARTKQKAVTQWLMRSGAV
ncbi:Uncharacterised protein [Klebsiella variicola]|uniref:Uncharacterized protein n=1 Tax=Klebsiella variicola TaxID=244366 RepID=A0A7H4MAH3_KLEVA|nr:Uncharacterised protein [Klebsiella variicola]